MTVQVEPQSPKACKRQTLFDCWIALPWSWDRRSAQLQHSCGHVPPQDFVMLETNSGYDQSRLEPR